MTSFNIMTSLVISTSVYSATLIQIHALAIPLVINISRITALVTSFQIMAFLLPPTRIIETLVNILALSVIVFVTMWTRRSCRLWSWFHGGGLFYSSCSFFGSSWGFGCKN